MSASRIIPAADAATATPWALARLVPDAVDAAGVPQRPVLAATADVDPVAVERDRLQRELAALRDAARDEGARLGFEQGRARAAEEQARWRALVDAVAAADAQFEAQLSHEVARLALEAARQLARGALAADPARVLSIVREALAALPGATGERRIALHPDDAALVRDAFGATGEAPGWTVTDDASIARGGCRLRTASADLDATIDARWRRIVAALGHDIAWDAVAPDLDDASTADSASGDAIAASGAPTPRSPPPTP